METKRDLVKCGKWIKTYRKNIWGNLTFVFACSACGKYTIGNKVRRRNPTSQGLINRKKVRSRYKWNALCFFEFLPIMITLLKGASRTNFEFGPAGLYNLRTIIPYDSHQKFPDPAVKLLQSHCQSQFFPQCTD